MTGRALEHAAPILHTDRVVEQAPTQLEPEMPPQHVGEVRAMLKRAEHDRLRLDRLEDSRLAFELEVCRRIEQRRSDEALHTFRDTTATRLARVERWQMRATIAGAVLSLIAAPAVGILLVLGWLL